MDLNEIIDKQAAGIAKSLGMPTIKTTSVEKEIAKTLVKKKFGTRVFVILDDISGEDYADFINEILQSRGRIEIMREETNWSKDGELIRVVDFMQKVE